MQTVKQDQFLQVASVDDARTRWYAALALDPRPAELVPLDRSLGRTLAEDIVAPGDVPAFDRSNVDGFAVRAADTFGADERTPRLLRIAEESIDAGHAPTKELEAGHAVVIATGGVVPRGADAVVMVEDTETDGDLVKVTRPVSPGGRISNAGSDITRGETLLRAGLRLSARETGTLAACGVDPVACRARVRVAVLSTGDEIVAPGTTLAPGQVHDANATLLADAIRELGDEAHVLGIAPDDAEPLRRMLREAWADSDVILLSGGTSKGGGDLSYRVLAEEAEIIVHGVALKPGKPLCLAAWDRKPVVILPGFPTSAIFTFHAFVVPVLGKLAGRAGLPASTIRAKLSRHIRSDRGRAEFTLVSLVGGDDGWVAFPMGKGSGSVTTFARADGFFQVPANVEYVEADDVVDVTLLGRDLRPAALVIVGSHCTGLDVIVGDLSKTLGDVKVITVGSRGGVDALRHGACDIAPVHLFDKERGTWNESFAPPGTRLLRGYGRTQGLAFRAEHGDHFSGDVEAAFLRAARDETLRLANRNPASGTRILVEELLGDAPKPAGWATSYTSHTAVAASIAQRRADYGICLASAARKAGLEWRPWRAEQYDFLVPDDRWTSPGVTAFRKTLATPKVRAALEDAGFEL